MNKTLAITLVVDPTGDIDLPQGYNLYLERISKPRSAVAAFARTRSIPRFARTLASAATGFETGSGNTKRDFEWVASGEDR